jgi:hypothetical protein
VGSVGFVTVSRKKKTNSGVPANELRVPMVALRSCSSLSIRRKAFRKSVYVSRFSLEVTESDVVKS